MSPAGGLNNRNLKHIRLPTVAAAAAATTPTTTMLPLQQPHWGWAQPWARASCWCLAPSRPHCCCRPPSAVPSAASRWLLRAYYLPMCQLGANASEAEALAPALGQQHHAAPCSCSAGHAFVVPACCTSSDAAAGQLHLHACIWCSALLPPAPQQ